MAWTTTNIRFKVSDGKAFAIKDIFNAVKVSKYCVYAIFSAGKLYNYTSFKLNYNNEPSNYRIYGQKGAYIDLNEHRFNESFRKFT